MDFFTGGVIRLTHWSLGLTASEARVTAFFGEAGDAAGRDRHGDACLLAGGGAPAGSRLDLQLFLDGGGVSLSLAAARRRRHALDRARAGWMTYPRVRLVRRGPGHEPFAELRRRLNEGRLHAPTHRPLTKSPSNTVLITGRSDSRRSV